MVANLGFQGRVWFFFVFSQTGDLSARTHMEK